MAANVTKSESQIEMDVKKKLHNDIYEFLCVKIVKQFQKKDKFTPVTLANMQLAMTVSKSQKCVNARPISSIVLRLWKKSGQHCHCHANIGKMAAMTF
jgi:hypothetical protein